ncbi:YhcN/YlaJ family sporulation lipoprotein [Aneurinibacillus migulanus]|uniref:YhcN/YlaJ family sporulation lipoprotein n=1 Tax=Aneurinibacillus migulanus TaxID=47500 RepID=UPI00069682EB|nr:YhcN/YlaJ family sporulation lipoprotein [Aneurinibacillus migulanus]CEH27682.1 Sporulation lipoprotein YhcN/YlaJ [Aneurinibacillus migulanus]
MKKFFAVLSAVGLAVSLTACSPAANDTRTNEYRPMNVGPNNPTGTVTGYDKYHRYNNANGNNNLFGITGNNTVGDGRYDTYRNGIIKDQTNHRPGVLYDSRDRIMNNQGMNNLGVNQYGQRMYGTNGINGTYGTGTYGTPGTYGTYGTGTYGTPGTYGTNGMNGYGNNAHQYSIYKPGAQGTNVMTRSSQPSIGYAHLGDNQNGTGQTYNGTTVQNRTAPNNSTLYQGKQANYDTATPNVYVDRQMLASAVASVAKQVPGVKRATVLSTDNQIFVGCDTSGMSAADAQKVLEKVQKGCENVSPRYYKVYTTNDQNVITKVHNNAMQMGTKTDQQFEQIIGHQANTMHKLSTNSESNKASSSKANPTHK